ncbi:bacteriohopanetetrol glucosamine biosynthesis glycosyltransferase HpnI [Asaia bogorensis]|uniref:bacteriohopanetetrol glucosamine biosynthesis glycosyltransferase HpnI n=1 Tax=Asaia bogorensis TaxID=91915 RepID=UPI002864FD9C|nr:bacteriohopanetetrol glucosamine biosynthesis glycosyltransferase HpnI [Asaia bogorensis]MDR6183685.1 ceramide glucosyltransferase [Asaia bogorensis NBRC 16594]
MTHALNWAGALTVLGYASACLALAGCTQSVIGAGLLSAFRRNERKILQQTPVNSSTLAPVTVLKPLHGDEPLLEEALRSFCEQDYAQYQIVFGVQRGDDPAIAIVRRLQRDYPELDLDLVIDGTTHGANRKIANLINMYPAARHDILVVSDSDIHVQRSYLRDVVQTLSAPEIGLVTTLYAGLSATRSIVRQFAASQINHNFMPGVMMSRLLGRQDCLGATMAFTRATLERIGGLQALADHVADDAVLGQLVRAHSRKIALAPCLTWTTVAEATARDMIDHELRWGRTVKNVEPVGYGLSAIQLPLFWASVTLACFQATLQAEMFFLAVWAIRSATAFFIDRLVGQSSPAVYALFPLREWLSAGIMVGSARGQKVEWRGQTLHIGRTVPVTPPAQPVEPGD